MKVLHVHFGDTKKYHCYSVYFHISTISLIYLNFFNLIVIFVICDINYLMPKNKISNLSIDFSIVI